MAQLLHEGDLHLRIEDPEAAQPGVLIQRVPVVAQELPRQLQGLFLSQDAGGFRQAVVLIEQAHPVGDGQGLLPGLRHRLRPAERVAFRQKHRGQVRSLVFGLHRLHPFGLGHVLKGHGDVPGGQHGHHVPVDQAVRHRGVGLLPMLKIQVAQHDRVGDDQGDDEDGLRLAPVHRASYRVAMRRPS